MTMITILYRAISNMQVTRVAAPVSRPQTLAAEIKEGNFTFIVYVIINLI